jgi:hypothetical protein
LIRVAVFIDGFNVYHSINENLILKKYKWLNFYSLSKYLININKKIIGVYFFTALAYWNPDKVKRHNIYIKALEENNVIVVKG